MIRRRAPFLRTYAARVLLATALASSSGCSRKPTAAEGLAELHRTFVNLESTPAIQLAIAAVETNDLGEGVIALQSAKRLPGLTADQLQAVEQTSQSLTGELLKRAEAGDVRARADLELIERSRSQ